MKNKSKMSAMAGKKPAVPTEDQLKQAVNDELLRDLRITDPGKISVDALIGEVTLHSQLLV